MSEPVPVPSTRRIELLEAAYHHVLTSGLSDMSLRPLASAIGSSPRVLLYLFGSKDGLIAALLQRARFDELGMLAEVRRLADSEPPGLAEVARHVWSWLAAPEHRSVLRLWVEAYARSLVAPAGAWAGFARATVDDWLAILAAAQPATVRETADGLAARTGILAILRGALLDLLATGDVRRSTAAIDHHLSLL
jgi:AcrR family transcriptional regulator